MTDDERKFVGIDSLPVDLYEARLCLREDKFIMNVLGPHVSKKYLEAKEQEWNSCRRQVTQWELDEYLNKY